MRYLACAVVLLAACIVGDQRESEQEQSAGTWGVYDPQPGHPTLVERDRFVAEVSDHAREAEVRYGVPAAAITAMACNESDVEFADRRDAVLYVASKLAANARYKPHTDRYRADIANGVDVVTAANRWTGYRL